MGFVNRTDVTVAYLDNGQKSFIISIQCSGVEYAIAVMCLY